VQVVSKMTSTKNVDIIGDVGAMEEFRKEGHESIRLLVHLVNLVVCKVFLFLEQSNQGYVDVDKLIPSGQQV
jgi:hypothetical protein